MYFDATDKGEMVRNESMINVVKVVHDGSHYSWKRPRARYSDEPVPHNENVCRQPWCGTGPPMRWMLL